MEKKTKIKKVLGTQKKFGEFLPSDPNQGLDKIVVDPKRKTNEELRKEWEESEKKRKIRVQLEYLANKNAED